MSEIATTKPQQRGGLVRSNWTELAKAAEKNPLMLVPELCRVSVMRLWMCNAHVMASCLSLASTIRLYVEEQGLKPSDVDRICDKMLEPGRRANQRGAWDVMADLSGLVDEVLRRQAAREDCRERREESAKFVGDLFKPPE